MQAHTSPHVVVSVITALVLAISSASCMAESDPKAVDVAAIGKLVGIRSWAEDRSKARSESLNKAVAVFWQHVDSSWPSISVEARRELDIAATSYITVAQADYSPDKILRVWEESLSKQLSASEARSLRLFYESPLGAKLLVSTGNASAAVTEYLDSTLRQRIDGAYKRFLDEATNIQRKYSRP